MQIKNIDDYIKLLKMLFDRHNTAGEPKKFSTQHPVFIGDYYITLSKAEQEFVLAPYIIEPTAVRPEAQVILQKNGIEFKIMPCSITHKHYDGKYAMTFIPPWV